MDTIFAWNGVIVNKSVMQIGGPERQTIVVETKVYLNVLELFTCGPCQSAQSVVERQVSEGYRLPDTPAEMHTGGITA